MRGSGELEVEREEGRRIKIINCFPVCMYYLLCFWIFETRSNCYPYDSFAVFFFSSFFIAISIDEIAGGGGMGGREEVEQSRRRRRA